MTADMMIVCYEDNSFYEGGAICDAAVCALKIDETSMGSPSTEFGEWFQDRFCGAPSTFDQLAGDRDHYFTKITTSDVVAVEHALANMDVYDYLEPDELRQYMKNHVGKHISTENW